MLGVRLFDIRLRCNHNVLYCHHGPVYVFSDFDDVLSAVQAHLKNYPSETVILKLQEDEQPKDCTEDFYEVINQYLKKYPDIFRPADYKTNYTVGEWRGYASLMTNTPANVTVYHLVETDFYALFNDWALHSPSDVTEKLPREIVEFANQHFNEKGKFRKWLTSAAAANAEVFAEYEITFPMTPHHIWQYENPVLMNNITKHGSYGWIGTDFAHFSNVNHIISLNF